MRIKIITKPPKHATGELSTQCECKGQTGYVFGIEFVANEELLFIRLDKGGRVAVPVNCTDIIGD